MWNMKYARNYTISIGRIIVARMIASHELIILFICFHFDQ